MENLGEFAALGTALCWTVTALSFESAGKKVGSLSVNLIRLWIAFVLLTLYSWIFRGTPLPTDADGQTWFWLSLSGLAGFVIGDLFLFQAFVTIGARTSMLIFSAVPPITAFIGWLALGETLSLVELIGVAMTTGGITAVVGEREAQNETVTVAGASGLLADAAEAPTKAGGGSESGRDSDGEPASRGDVESGGRLEIEGEKPESSDRSNTGRARRLRGALFALGGALGQASGLVLSRVGVGSYDPFAATQIRGIAGIIGFSLIFTAFRKWKDIAAALRNAEAMRRIGLGAFFGPFLGVSLSLLAVQNTTAGIASTIMALVPVLIIPPAALFFREKIRVKEVIAALVAVAGVSLLFLT